MNRSVILGGCLAGLLLLGEARILAHAPAKYPGIVATMLGAFNRSGSDAAFHGTWVSARPDSRSGSIYRESSFQISLVRALDTLRTCLEEQRDHGRDRLYDLKMAGTALDAYEHNHLETWRLQTAVLLAPKTQKLQLATAAWSDVAAVFDGDGLPPWARGRMRTYLGARALCDAMLVAGEAADLQAEIWKQRWEGLGRRVAALEPDIWTGAMDVEEEFYAGLVHIKRRQLGIETVGRPEEDHAHVD